jgi:hypothetical protein
MPSKKETKKEATQAWWPDKKLLEMRKLLDTIIDHSLSCQESLLTKPKQDSITDILSFLSLITNLPKLMSQDLFTQLQTDLTLHRASLFTPKQAPKLQSISQFISYSCLQ